MNWPPFLRLISNNFDEKIQRAARLIHDKFICELNINSDRNIPSCQYVLFFPFEFLIYFVSCSFFFSEVLNEVLNRALNQPNKFMNFKSV